MKKLLLILATVVAALMLAAQALAAPSDTFITDTLAPGGGKAVPQQVEGYRFITDTLAPGGGTGGTTPVTVHGDGFSWSAAGVGALTAVGIVLVLAGAALTAVRRRTVVTS